MKVCRCVPTNLIVYVFNQLFKETWIFKIRHYLTELGNYYYFENFYFLKISLLISQQTIDTCKTTKTSSQCIRTWGLILFWEILLKNFHFEGCPNQVLRHNLSVLSMLKYVPPPQHIHKSWVRLHPLHQATNDAHDCKSKWSELL